MASKDGESSTKPMRSGSVKKHPLPYPQWDSIILPSSVVHISNIAKFVLKYT